MRSSFALAVLAVVVATGATAGAARAAESITVGGVARAYELFVPPTIAVKTAGATKAPPPPLLVVLHGRTGTAAQIREHSGFDDFAKKYGVVVAYPDGIEHRWADLRMKTVPVGVKANLGPATDDVGFILALVDDLVKRGLADPARVYLAGHSNGAIFTLTLACTHAERFAGIAVVAGNLPKTTCDLAKPVSAIFFHGSEDPLVPFAGGNIGKGGQRGVVLSADDTVKVFADKAGCGPAVKRAPVDKVKDDGATLVVEDRAHCAAQIAHVVSVGGGHGWPGRRPIFLKGTKEIDATAAIADFFFAGKGP